MDAINNYMVHLTIMVTHFMTTVKMVVKLSHSTW